MRKMKQMRDLAIKPCEIPLYLYLQSEWDEINISLMISTRYGRVLTNAESSRTDRKA